MFRTAGLVSLMYLDNILLPIPQQSEDEEVMYEDFIRDRDKFLQGQYERYGWTKIAKGCQIARDWGLEWLWIDTCCIDKKSSAELSEAINSMFVAHSPFFKIL